MLILWLLWYLAQFENIIKAFLYTDFDLDLAEHQNRLWKRSSGLLIKTKAAACCLVGIVLLKISILIYHELPLCVSECESVSCDTK